MPDAYAHLCPGCDHLASGHGLAEDGDLRDGPYVCACGCKRPQDGPWVPLTRSEFLLWETGHAAGSAPESGDPHG